MHRKQDQHSECSTETEFSPEREKVPPSLKTNPLKHKTELCKTFSLLGHCNYGRKCRFAHGKDELVIRDPLRQFKKRRCLNFHEKGNCLYGTRCQFSHGKLTWESKAIQQGIKSILVQESSSELKSRLIETKAEEFFRA